MPDLLMDFCGLGIRPEYQSALERRGIQKPVEIQTRVIPRLLAGENLIFRSATGTGKTFAYLLPLFQRFIPDEGGALPGASGPAILVLAPTFELCAQIRGEADFLLEAAWKGPGKPPRAGLLIGQAPLSRQIEDLKHDRPAVIAGNPGRTLLLVKMKKLRLDNLRALVLDEGDRLASDELFPETAELLGLVRKLRATLPDGVRPFQTAVCSATMPAKSLERLAPFAGDAETVTGDENILRDKITHWAFFSENRRKTETLRSFLAAAKPRKTLVFTSRPHDAAIIAARLQHHHIASAALHGKMEKQERRRALEDFRNGRITVLVTSDLASRGLDIGGISHVVALDVPDDETVYLHRAGRSARAGKKGIMASIGDETGMRTLARLEKRLGITVYPKEIYGGRILAPETDSA